MTCREKLMMEHPEKIDSSYDDGCYGCPHNYKYLPAPEYCKAATTEFNPEHCKACWGREIPDTEPLYPRLIIPALNINWDDLCEKLIDARKKLMRGGFNSNDSARMINTILRSTYGYGVTPKEGE
jgi:hypothetical protein